jgi:DNA-binding transcriptional LysR family regulator
MDLETLTVFVEVLRRGSFAAVARDRNVAPSSISRAIAQLEEQLGGRLFQRTTRRVAPTEAGLAYFEKVEPLVEELARANQGVADSAQQPRGTLRLTTSVSFGHERVLPLLPDFAARYPALSVEAILTDAVVDLVAERIDVAVRLGRLPDSRFIAQRLIGTEYRVCAAPAYFAKASRPRRPADLAAHNCVLFPLPGFRSRWIFRDRRGNTIRVPVKGNAMISSAIGIRQCVLAGMGVGLLPDWLVADDLRAGRLVDPLPGWQVTATDFDTAVWAIYASRAYVPQKIRLFVDHLKDRLASPGRQG